IGFAVMLFKVTPALITDWIGIKRTGWFVIVEGMIRVTLFILYLTLISLLPDLRRVFQYHAAEHKAINAYAAWEGLEPETGQLEASVLALEEVLSLASVASGDARKFEVMG